MHKHIHGTLILVILCSLAAACTKFSTEPNQNEPPQIASTDVVKANPEETTIARGESGEVVVPLKITHGYHVNANPPSYSYLRATELEIPAAEGISVEFITYPDPQIRTFAFAEKPLAVYEGEVILKAKLRADKAVQPGKHNLSAKLRVQACDEKVCYAPGELDVQIPVNIK